MATYILGFDNSDLVEFVTDFERKLIVGTETPRTINIGVANEATETSWGFTEPNVPNNDDWETGSISVEVDVTTADAGMHLDIDASRLNSAGVVQETTSSMAGEQNISSAQRYDFTIPSFNWSAGNCGDRLRINYHFRSANSHGGSIFVIIATGTTETEIVTSITEDTGACTAGGEGTQINIGDSWKEVAGVQINIGDSWKTVAGMQINIGDTWKVITI